MMKILTVILLLGICIDAFAQSADLQFILLQNGGNNYDIKIQIRSDSAFNLGSSNIKFNFNDQDIGNPVLLNASNFSGDAYYDMTVSQSAPDIASINIELTNPGTVNGTEVSTGWKDVASVRFTVLNSSGNSQLVFRNMYPAETRNPTVIYKDNEAEQVSEGTFYGLNTSTPIEDLKKIPDEFGLSQNYPNPFNPTTQINYSIPSAQKVNLKVYDELGKEVATLVNNEQAAGNYTVDFDASRFASGVYFYRIQAGSFNQIKKMILMK